MDTHVHNNHDHDYEHFDTKVSGSRPKGFNEDVGAQNTSVEMGTHLHVGGEESKPSIFEMLGAVGIGAALRSVADTATSSLGKGVLITPEHQLFSSPQPLAESPAVSPSPHHLEDKSTCSDLEEVEDEVLLNEDFGSNLFHNVPLYQEYLLKSMKADIQRVHQTGLSDLVASQQWLPGLECPAQPGLARSARLSLSPTPAVLKDRGAYSLWQELSVVKEQGLLGLLTAKEVRRQETMFELLTSEASYLKSLRVAVNHFQCSKALQKTLSSLEHHILFSNLRGVCGVSESFLLDLERHLQESVVMSKVGDIVLHHRMKLHAVYVPYVTNLMYQEDLMSKLQKKHRFSHVLHKLERDAKCQRQTLKSFLVLPFQRITRIKLILEATLKLTDPDVSSFGPLSEAIDVLHQIVSECNKKVLCMKQTEELVHLEKLLDFGQMKAIPLTKPGRYLVREGRLRQTDVRVCAIAGSTVSFSDVYLHLFNDLLLLSVERESHFSVLDYAWFPCNVHAEDIKANILGQPKECFLLHLTPSHTGSSTTLILVANTCTERDLWVNALNSHR